MQKISALKTINFRSHIFQHINTDGILSLKIEDMEFTKRTGITFKVKNFYFSKIHFK